MLTNAIGSGKFLVVCDDCQVLDGVTIPNDALPQIVQLSTDPETAAEARMLLHLDKEAGSVEVWSLSDLVPPHVRVVYVEKKSLEGPPETQHMRGGGVEGPPIGTIVRNPKGELFSVTQDVAEVYFQFGERGAFGGDTSRALYHNKAILVEIATAVRNYLRLNEGESGDAIDRVAYARVDPTVPRVVALMTQFERIMGKDVLERSLPGVSLELKLAAIEAHGAMYLSLKMLESYDFAGHRRDHLIRQNIALVSLRKYLAISGELEATHAEMN